MEVGKASFFASLQVAPKEDNKQVETAMKDRGKKAPPGCLLRRVNADLHQEQV